MTPVNTKKEVRGCVGERGKAYEYFKVYFFVKIVPVFCGGLYIYVNHSPDIYGKYQSIKIGNAMDASTSIIEELENVEHFYKNIIY
ncbi:hypothetical protein [Methanolobus sp. ZRKC5]|uniref:hypothetical protein n=1 Tax=unclassified Methanolobus TaxID=2629569 RepID=UPI00313D6CBA